MYHFVLDDLDIPSFISKLGNSNRIFYTFLVFKTNSTTDYLNDLKLVAVHKCIISVKGV